MTVITSETVKYHRNVFSQLKIYVTTPVRCPSKFSCYVTMISNFFIIIINEFFTYPTFVTRLELFFLFTHYQIFVKMFFQYFFTILILFKNCFNKLISSIFTNYRLDKFIINTNKLVSKTTRNVILLFFWVRTFTTYNTF